MEKTIKSHRLAGKKLAGGQFLRDVAEVFGTALISAGKCIKFRQK